MFSFNRVMLLGNCGKDTECKTAGSSMLAKFSLATTAFVDGQEQTAWHNIEAWGKTAELCAKHLKKGSKVFVEGRIKYSSWDKDGVKQYRTDIVAERVVFVSSVSGEKQTSSGKVVKFDNQVVPENFDIPF